MINLGTGVGYSVLDMVKAFSKACGKRFLMKSNQEEPEILRCVMQILQKAARVLGWKAEDWMRCVQTHGDGSLRIRMDTKNNKDIIIVKRI